MDKIKKSAILIAIVIVGILDILIYWNNHLYYRAEKVEESQKKIEILKKAADFYPSSDLVFYERGRAYFDLGFNSLSDKAQSAAYFKESINSFKQSIKSNPASYFSHFNLAQSLLYMSYLFPDLNVSYREGYKKAAALAGENSEIFYEVGKIFFSCWPHLSYDDKKFTLDILRQVVSKKDKEKLRSLFYIWEMNIADYNVIEKILIEDPDIYRIYAEFLGEKSLSLKERQEILAKAEFLEFKRAKEEYDSGEHELFYYRMEEAYDHFNSCLNILRRIKFYQNLSPHAAISLSEFNELQKSALINIAKCGLEQGKELKEVEDYLRGYLSLEDNVTTIGDLESYLKKRNLIGHKLEDNLNDLDPLSFELLLYFKQNRYTDIMKIGRLLRKSFLILSEDKKKAYVRVLQLIGDAFQKVDYVYDASDFYQKALDVDPDNLETLIRIRKNYQKINADKKINNVNRRIENILTPREKDFKNYPINKSRGSSHKLILDGRKTVLDFHFNFGDKGINPLISIFFNGHIVWENYLEEEVLSLPVESKVGENFLRIVPLNRAVSLVKLAYN